MWTRKQEECGSQRGWRSPGGQCPLNQLSKVLKNSQRLKQPKQGLHKAAPGPLCIFYNFTFSISMGILNV